MLIVELVGDKDIGEALKAIDSLAARNGEAPREHPTALYRQIWNLDRRSLSVLKDKKTGEIFGYSVCAPLKEAFVNKFLKLKKEKKAIKDNLKIAEVLHQSDAQKLLDTGGNILFIVINSWSGGKLDFHIGLPLFFGMELRFYQMRSRIILCETRRERSKQMIRASGSKSVYSARTGDEIFYFDRGLLRKPESITSGLGVVMAHIWGPPGISPLALSPNQKLVARGLMEGLREKNLPEYLETHYNLKLSPHTVNDYIKNIRMKAKSRLGIEERATLIAYLALQNFELYPAPDSRKHKLLTDLI